MGKKITKRFGGLEAVKEFDFYVDDKEIVGLIGPNGAGKTTLFNIITGIYPPTSGKIEFNGMNITGLKPHQICKLGLVRTFQIPRPFLKMTTLENVMTGSLFGKNRSINDARKMAINILELMGLSEKKNVPATSLSFHERRMLEIARALAAEPQLLLIDEAMAGLNPGELLVTMELLKKIRNEWKITVFWIEHVMRAIMNVAERIIVINQGQKIAEGSPTEIGQDEKVIEAYLGTSSEVSYHVGNR